MNQNQINHLAAHQKNEIDIKYSLPQTENNNTSENITKLQKNAQNLQSQQLNHDQMLSIVQSYPSMIPQNHAHFLQNSHQSQLLQLYKGRNGNSTGTGGIGNKKMELSSQQSNQNNATTNKYYLNQEEVVINIEGFRFQPSTLYIHAGTKLVWHVKTNKPIYNTLYDSTGPRFFIISIPQLEEESPPIHENESYSYTVNQTGQFDMICPNYTRMKGSLTVYDKSITPSDLNKEIQPKACFMEQVDEFKYSSLSQNQSSQNQTQQQSQQQFLQQMQINIQNSSSQQTHQVSESIQLSQSSSALSGENSSRNTKQSSLINGYKDNNISSFNSHSNLQIQAHSNSHGNQIHPKNNLYYQMSNSQKSDTKNDSSISSENTRKNSCDQLSLAHSPSLTLFQSTHEANEKNNFTESSKSMQQFSKQEKILTKIIDSNHTETAESEKIAKDFMQELEDEQNNQQNKKKNIHYLQLYKDDFQEDVDEDEDELDAKSISSTSSKNKKQDTGNKKNQSLLLKSTENKIDETRKLNDKFLSKSGIMSQIQQGEIIKNIQEKNEKREVGNLKEKKMQKQEKDSSIQEQVLQTPKKKSVLKQDISTNHSFKKISHNNSNNKGSSITSSSHQINSYQNITTIKEEETDINNQEIKNNTQKGGLKKQQQDQQNNNEILLEESSQTPTNQIASSSTITTNATALTSDDKKINKSQEFITSFNIKNNKSLQNTNNQVKPVKKNSQIKQISNDKQQINEQQQNEQEQNKLGYDSDYDCGENEDDNDVNIERRKKVLLLKYGGNSINHLYFRGHNNYQQLRNYQNQYGRMGIANEDDEYDDDGQEMEDDYQYDCNTIISEEDASAYTSKENSLVYRRNNSSSNLQSTGSGIAGSNDKPNNSFTASQTLNKRFTKRIRRNYRKKPKIGGLSDNYLKSPAQSILTTAESSKYSDTTKQLSQKGDFELEGNDMHERGGLLFQHKYSQKRRASTDQTIQESRYNNNNNEDSDTRSIKSLKNEPNITNSSNMNNLNQQNCPNINNNPCGNGFGCNTSISGYNNENDCYQNGCSLDNGLRYYNNEIDAQQNELYTTQKCNFNKFIKNNNGNLGLSCCSSCCNAHSCSTTIFDFIKQQTKLQFLNFTENIQKQRNNIKESKKDDNNNNFISSSNQSSASIERISENQEDNKSQSSNNISNMSPKIKEDIQDNQKNNIKLIENYNPNSINIQNELQILSNNIQHTNEQNESIQEQIEFVHSLLEQRYEIESWLLSAQDDTGEIEDY